MSADSQFDTEFFRHDGGTEVRPLWKIFQSCRDGHVPSQDVLDAALYRAVDAGNLFLVQNLVHHGARVANVKITYNSTYNGKTCLHLAAEKGLVSIVEVLASQKENCVNYTDHDRNTALHLCQEGSEGDHITKYLLAAGAEVNRMNEAGETPLMKALKKHNISSVVQLVKAKSDVRLRNRDGVSANSLAELYGMDGLLEVCRPDSSQSPLVEAAVRRDINIMTLLLTAWDDSECKEDYFSTLNQFLCDKYDRLFRKGGAYQIPDACHLKDQRPEINRFDNDEIEIVRLLLNVRSKTGRPHGRYCHFCKTATKIGDIRILRMILDTQSSQEMLNSHKIENIIEAVHSAVETGRCDILEVLLAHLKISGVQTFDDLAPYVKNKIVQNGHVLQQSFRSAAKKGCTECASRLMPLLDMSNYDFKSYILVSMSPDSFQVYLLLKTAHPDKFSRLVSDRNNRLELLYEACDKDCLAVAQDLLASGINSNSSYDEVNPLMRCKSEAMTDLLVQQGADVYFGFKQALSENSLDVVRLLINHIPYVSINEVTKVFSKAKYRGEMRKLILESYRYDLNQLDRKGRSVLALAALDEDLKFVKILIEEKGVDVNVKPSCQDLNPPLIVAVDVMNEAMTRLMLTNGANPDVQNEHGDTALIVACRKLANAGSLNPDISKCSHSIIQLLLDKGADANIFNHSDESALFLTARSDVGIVISLLAQHSADVNAIRNNNSALHIAADHDNFEGFCSLITCGANVNIELDHQTILEKLLCKRQSRICFVQKLLQSSATITSSDCMSAVHYCIIAQEHELLSDLIQIGCFSPTVMVDGSQFFSIDHQAQGDLEQLAIAMLTSVGSPLCMALMSGQVGLARNMMEALYLTPSDMTLLAQNAFLIFVLESRKLTRSLEFLQELCSSPPRLMWLSFVKVSHLVGPPPGRKDRVERLALPGKLKRHLLFSSGNKITDVSASESGHRQPCLSVTQAYSSVVDEDEIPWLTPSTYAPHKHN